MSTILVFFKYQISSIIKKIKSVFKISYLQSSNPTCFFHSSSEINNSTFGKYVKLFENTKIFNSNIDSFSYVQENSRVFNCDIGKFCSLASNISIGPGIHNYNNVSTHPSFLQKSSPLPKVFSDKDYYTTKKKVKIGNDVWIGQNVIILDGIKISNGSVIAAGSVVTRDVEKYSIVGGVPAVFIKYRFDKKTINKIESSKWWNNSIKWFEKNFIDFKDVNNFNKLDNEKKYNS